ncbi:MAG: hypothetical protein ABW213_09685 [Tardiphaga sp.]
MSKLWTASRRSFDVPCTIEIEQTPETLHAHVMLDGDIDIRPGDEVRVHDAPTDIRFGERIVVRRTATVVRGSVMDRIRARIEGYLELTELYEVSFSDGRAS